jgi:hypothetical protein
MSNQLLLPAIPPILESGDGAVPLRHVAQAGDAAATFRQPAPAQEAVAKPVPLFVNPSFQFDPTVGMVVINFHNDVGKVTNSIPTQRQLEAYRANWQTRPGEQSPPAPNIPKPVDGKTTPG